MRSMRLRSEVRQSEVHPLGEIPREVVLRLARELTAHKLLGNADLSGDAWADAWAAAVGGESRKKPDGLDDVVLGSSAWSCKTVQHKNPMGSDAVARFIVGRCDPLFSADHDGGEKTPNETGEIVLKILNKRIGREIERYGDVRFLWCRRNFDTMEFLVVEERLAEVVVGDYTWCVNKQMNLEGRSGSGVHEWTWQRGGTQLTRLRSIPRDGVRFRVEIGAKIPLFSRDEVLDRAGWNDEWVEVYTRRTT